MSEYTIIGIISAIGFIALALIYMRVQLMYKSEYEMYLLRKQHADQHLEKPDEADGSLYLFVGLFMLVALGSNFAFVSCERQNMNESNSVRAMQLKLDSMNNHIQLIECDMRNSLSDTITIYLNDRE